VFGAIGIVLASMQVQPGVGLGLGYLDQSLGVELRAELTLLDKGWSLRLAAPIRALYDTASGFRLRGEDWDEAGDYSALLESLQLGNEQRGLRGGRLLLSAGHGSVIDGYRAGGHPDQPAAGLAGHWRTARVDAQVAVDRISDPGLVFGHARYALRPLLATSTWLPSSALTLAVDPRPAAPQSQGVDGRIALDVESLWRWRDHRLGLYADGVLGLGPQWAWRQRLHSGLLAVWRERNWRLGLRAEVRRSADGLPAGPYDNLYALFRYEEGFVRPAASDALGWGVQLTAQRDQHLGFTLRWAQDPYGDDSMQRVEARARWSWQQRGAVYLAGGYWETGNEPPSWYAQSEGRLSVAKGLAAWLRLRRMRRSIAGQEQAVVDVLVGLSGALSVRAQR
jgi:hypothetical protein